MERESVVRVFCFGLMLLGSFFVREAKAATRTVDNTSDNGSLTACTAAANDCSLRGAGSLSVAVAVISCSGRIFKSAFSG